MRAGRLAVLVGCVVVSCTTPIDLGGVDNGSADSGGDAGAVDAGAEAQLDSPAESSAGSPADTSVGTGTDSAAAADGGRGFTSAFAGDVWEGGTHLAVGTNGYVAAVWLAGTTAYPGDETIFVRATFSTDGGATWTPVQTLDDEGCGHDFDPSVAVDAANNFYVAFVCNGPYSSVIDPHLYVVKAPAGTTTFGAPSEVTDPAEGTPKDAGVPLYWYDDPWIGVTPNQEIVVMYSRREWATCPANVNLKTPMRPCGILMVGRSTDAVTWTRGQISPDSAGSDGGPDAGAGFAFTENHFPCVSATTGRLWVVYETVDANASASVVLQYSDDDGATWSNPTNIAKDIFTAFISDVTTCAADGDDVWVEYEVRSGPGLAGSIQVVHSTNAGQTFESAVNALDVGTSSLTWHAALVLEAGGHLDIEYYGGTSDGSTNAGVYFVHSTDQGATWGKATLVHAPIALIDDEEGGGWTNTWLGRYLGVTAAGGSLYTTFTDNSSGVAHVDFAKVALP